MRRLLSLTIVALVGAAGCIGDITPLGPGTGTGTGGGNGGGTGGGANGDMGGSGTTDGMSGGGGTDMASGNQNVTFAQIQTDIDTLNCSNSTCHGTGGAGATALKLDVGDATNNYPLFKLDAMNGAMSLVLTKNEPVANGGVQHTGGNSFFAMTSNPIYQRWLAWINAGNPQ
jgi:hypothetical protein